MAYLKKKIFFFKNPTQNEEKPMLNSMQISGTCNSLKIFPVRIRFLKLTTFSMGILFYSTWITDCLTSKI